ncbi:hypothetical protein [Priestia abyssalis]|uniref:hypothetical protein n=1 Tax=Priestia abyssalis TaxID=1221450 RepID=UPI000994D027|nr:hypothetical protein [Priestia abyssalis]
MTPQQTEGVFDLFGLTSLYHRIRYPLELSGILEGTDEEMMERFMEMFEIHEHMSFEEFSHWFDWFSVVSKQIY